MRLCRGDPLLQLVFDRYRAHPIRVPESAIRPLLVFFRVADDEVSRIGPLRELAPPQLVETIDGLMPIPPSAMADIQAQESSSIDIDSSLDILGNFASAFGAAGCLPAVGAQLRRFRKASFIFNDVRREGFNPSAIGQILPAQLLPFDEHNAIVDTWITTSKRPTAYIIDSVLCSNEFTMHAFEALDASARFDHVPINALLSAGATLSIGTRSDTELSFKGVERLPFALTCLEVALSKKKGVVTIAPLNTMRKFLRGSRSGGAVKETYLSTEPTLLEWKTP